MAAEALQLVLSECKPNAKIVDVCEKGDSFIKEYVEFYDFLYLM